MIANSDINENGIIFSQPFFVGPAGVLKNQSSPLNLTIFFEIVLSLQKRGMEIGKV